MKIHFNTKKTEADWQRVLDDFWIKTTPRWFEWLGWVLILGAFSFLTKLTQNMILNIACGFSCVALFFYLQSFFSLWIYMDFLLSSRRKLEDSCRYLFLVFCPVVYGYFLTGWYRR